MALSERYLHFFVKFFVFCSQCLYVLLSFLGNRSLLGNLENTVSGGSMMSQGGDLCKEEEEDYDIPEQLEDIIDTLLNGLRDKVTL